MKKRIVGANLEDYTDRDNKFAMMVYDKPWKKDGYITSLAARTGYKNKISSDGINGELENIKKGVSPFSEESGAVDVKDAITLCQKAYWNVAIFRSTIDIQTEFSNSKIVFKSPNKTVQKFFTNWDERVGGWQHRDKFFREWFRSGNVFNYRLDGTLAYSEYRKMSRGGEKVVNQEKTIPVRYIVLNPADIKCLGAASFIDAEYGKLLNDYEVARLKNPKTDEDIALFNSLDEKSRQSLQSGTKPIIKLDPEKLRVVLCGAQDYEAMAVPMYYPVLADINLKLEFKKAEQVIARTVDYAVLLITCGDPKNDGIINDDIRTAVTQLFSSESVGRVLIADYSVKGEFIIPDLNKIFGSEKYKVVNDDIANGLMNIFFSEGKFANDLVKIQVFLERLNQARDAYINLFLKPEMKRIAKELNFTQIPEVCFEEANIKDEIELKKLYVRMAETGMLTVDETIRAIESGNLPLPEDSVSSHEEFKKLKDKGLYTPLLNQGKDAAAKEAGRQPGTKVPNQKKTVGPIGGSRNFSVDQIRGTIQMMNNVNSMVEAAYKEKNNIKRLSKKQREITWSLSESIFINEKSSKWEESVPIYLAQRPIDGDNTDLTLEISNEHEVSPIVGAILANSITEQCK